MHDLDFADDIALILAKVCNSIQSETSWQLSWTGSELQEKQNFLSKRNQAICSFNSERATVGRKEFVYSGSCISG